MAKYNIPEELDALIQEYLTDGIISAKERQVLLNKAASLGLNVDEVDLYIDAQQQKADQQVDAAVRKQRGQTCPFCGGSVPDLTDKCPHCGQHITVQANEEIKEIIEKLEDALVEFKSSEDYEKSKAMVERYVRKAQLYYSSNPKIQKLLADVKAESEIAEKNAKNKAKKKILVKILTYNKWLTTIAVLIIIAAIGWVIVSINNGMNPDLTKDSQACIAAIDKALKNDDIVKAEGLYAAYANGNRIGRWDIDAAGQQIIDYYIDHDNIDKALAMDDNLSAGARISYRGKLQDACIEHGDYEKAEEVSGYSNVNSKMIPLFTKIVKHMKKTGSSDAEIKIYIKGVIARAHPECKQEMREALEPLIVE